MSIAIRHKSPSRLRLESESATAASTDMSNQQAVQELARRAVKTFGRIDTWVNKHGVTLFARFEEAPMEDYRRVIEEDLHGKQPHTEANSPSFARR